MTGQHLSNWLTLRPRRGALDTLGSCKVQEETPGMKTDGQVPRIHMELGTQAL